MASAVLKSLLFTNYLYNAKTIKSILSKGYEFQMFHFYHFFFTNFLKVYNLCHVN